MLKKILWIFLIVISIGFISVFVRGYVYQSNVNNEKQTNNEIKENEKQTLIEEETISEIINTEDTTSNKTEETTSDEEVKKDSNTTQNVVEEKQTYNNNQSSIPKVEEQEQPIINEEETTTPWGDLGITEYEYYNSPMWSWDRVDFSVKDYGTQSATELACRNKGQEYFDQGYGFSCTNVNSYSGEYLGERLETF